MNTSFNVHVMRKYWIAIGFVCLASFPVTGQPVPVYENLGTVTNVPDINAITFINRGQFTVGSELPFQTQNTLNYTNTGSMFGDPGFRLELLKQDGSRFLAENFHQRAGATIQAGLGFISGIIFISTNNAGLLSFRESPVIDVRATNLINQGNFTVSSDGLIRLEGKNVDVSRSGFLVEFPLGGAGFVTPTNFFPEQGFSDNYWGMAEQADPPLNLANLANRFGNSLQVITPPHRITNEFGALGLTSIGLSQAKSYVFTNALSDTNETVQAVFVGGFDTNINVSVKFAASDEGRDLNSAVVQLAARQTNVVTGTVRNELIYFTDRIGSRTNFVLLTNLLTQITFMPSPYEVSRNFAPIDWFVGAQTNAVFTSNLFFGPTYSNSVVTNVYAAYSTSLTNASAPNLEQASSTNITGRVEIMADDLNMERTRIRGQSVVTIKAKNLISSENAVVDSPTLFYELGTPGKTLTVTNLAKDTVERLQGTIRAWSGVWTNTRTVITTNPPPQQQQGIAKYNLTPLSNGGGNGNGEPPPEPTLETNVVNVQFHVLVLQNGLATEQDVQVSGFQSDSSTTLLNDSLRVQESLLINGEALEVNRRLTISSLINDLNATTFPNLRSLTNNGAIGVPGVMKLGSDREEPYDWYVNTGTNVATSHRIQARNFVNSGRLVAGAFGSFGDSFFFASGPGTIDLLLGEASFQNGIVQTGGDLFLNANKARLFRSTNMVGGVFGLSVTNQISDNGGGSQNLIRVVRAVEMLTKPARGDLLGTTLELAPARFTSSTHTWAGEDRGAKKAGFQDNVTIGRLFLNNQDDALQIFQPANGTNAMYVDFIDFGPGAALDPENAVLLRPGFNIYFADSNVDINELENGEFGGGNFQWVKEFAGPNSSVEIALPSGETVEVNRRLRNSDTIDSDGDGIFNASDEEMFSPVLLREVALKPEEPSTLLLSWRAAADTVYQIEATQSLVNPQWETVKSFENTALTTELVTAEVERDPEVSARFYRVSYEIP